MALRRSADRGLVDKGWVRSRHTFSFGRYSHPDHNGFHSLIVLNEDWIDPAQGFERHAHSDTEIVTYLMSGQLLHEDSLGNRHLLEAGDVMATTTGRGLAHTESNPSPEQVLHLWQIWLLPERKRREPTCAHRAFTRADKLDRLCRVVTKDGRDGSLRLGLDLELLATVLSPGRALEHPLRPGRHAWIQLLRGGPVTVDGQELEAGDALGLDGERAIALGSPADASEAELLIFDLP